MIEHATYLYEYVLSSMDTPMKWAIVAMFVAVVLAAVLPTKKKGVLMVTGGQKKMSVQERDAVEDALTFAMEEAVYTGKMSRRSARYWYGRLAKDYGFSGLVIPKKWFKKLHKHRAGLLKEEIKARLENGQYKTKCTLPKDDTPPWEDSPKKGREKSSDKFKKFLATKAA